MATNWARVSKRKPWEYTVGVVDVLTGHLASFRVELERLLANSAVRLGGDVVVSDFDDGHGLDGGF